MSRTTNTILLRYGITTFWSSSLLTQKVSNTLLQFNNLCGLVLKNYFLNVLKIQCIKNNLILYTFKFNSQKQSFLVKYLMFLKKDNYNKLRHVYGINKNQKDAKKKKNHHVFYLTHLKILSLMNLHNTKKIKYIYNLKIILITNVKKKYIHNKLIFFFKKKKLIKLNSSIKLKLLELYLSSLIYFYSKKKIIIKLHLLTEKIQEVKLPFLFNILKDTEKKQRFIIIILSFMFFNAGILTTYLNNIITNLKNKKHIHTITFFFEKLRLTFLQQIVPLSGIKFKLAGRLNGKLRKSKYGYTIGSVKLMTLNLNFSYSYDCVYTQYGVFSLKLWLAEWNNINDQKKTI